MKETLHIKNLLHRKKKWKEFATLSRSWQLLKIFPQEQRNPCRFYHVIAHDTLQLLRLFSRDLEQYSPSYTIVPVAHKLSHDVTVNDDPLVLDIGAGPGYFAEVFGDYGLRYLSIEPDMAELSAYDGMRRQVAICASGYELPIKNDSCDIVMSSNVAEHVRYPWQLAEEMIRVAKPGGIIMLSYTIWFGPFGGHETGLWHYCGGKYAARRYTKRMGHSPKNNFGQSLFRVDVRDGLRWARSMQNRGKVQIIAAFPRYHPWWAWCVVKIPLLRELLVSNLVIIMQKKP